MRIFPRLVFIGIITAALAAAQSGVFSSGDLLKLRSAGGVAFSPDGTHLSYTVSNNDGPGRPYSQLWIMNLADGRSIRLAKEKESSGGAEWSPDGQWIAYSGHLDGKDGLIVSHPDGSAAKFITELKGTNSPLPSTGNHLAWSPDSKRLAFVNAVPGPETAEASGDPIVITRYLYKPDYSEGLSHFNDNRRLHIFVTDIASGQIRQLTDGTHYEHSIDWSPDGREIAFVSNREPNEDQFFNYDLFALRVSDGHMRRLTATENAEYQPRWSPDGKTIVYLGTKRGLTDLETTMEDTHVWLINADGSNRHELTGEIDNRQHEAGWSPDGKSIYFTVQDRGNVHLYRIPASGGRAEMVAGDRGFVGSWALSKDGALAYSFSTPSDMSEVYYRKSGEDAKKMTDLNAQIMAGKQIAEVEPFTFVSNDNKFEVEAYLTKPLHMTPGSKYPMVTIIHGGPHGQQGPAFSFRNQVYAGLGWATLMVNYRGSTGYGQKFADGVFGDQNGNEAQDVLYAVYAAMRRNLWIDRERLGVEGVSYGGQLSAWLVTQTNIFKASIPTAAIINLVSYNYMTYYNQYEQMEFGIFPHQGNLMDLMWQRSAIKYVAQVHTPVMLMHGENDADVPIAEAEQYYIGLKDVGVETVFVRYPREGHGLAEPKHQVDSIDRSIKWYEKHFPGGIGPVNATN
ncbi:MAG TPA: S9 family peptidase [Bryobacteraceae bacterium]|nr:S9 family peptidase [Bryobacteraceae bacterium]